MLPNTYWCHGKHQYALLCRNLLGGTGGAPEQVQSRRLEIGTCCDPYITRKVLTGYPGYLRVQLKASSRHRYQDRYKAALHGAGLAAGMGGLGALSACEHCCGVAPFPLPRSGARVLRVVTEEMATCNVCK